MNRNKSRYARLLLIAAWTPGSWACSDRAADGIDPSVSQRPLPAADAPVDTALARAGGEVFQRRCVACHKLGPGVAVGPDLTGVFERREPAWIHAMITRPDSMLRTDSVARALLYSYQVPMIDLELGEPEVRAVMEFLRAQPPP
jgi:mono/diheme cytochrome c family protein